MNIYKWPLCSSSAGPLFLLLQFLFVTLLQWCVQHFKIIGLQIQEHSQWMLRFWMRALCSLLNLVLFVLSSQNKRGNHFGSNFLVLSCLKVCVSVCMSICGCGCVCLAMPANLTRSVGASDVCMCDDVRVWLGVYAWVCNCLYVCRRERKTLFFNFLNPYPMSTPYFYSQFIFWHLAAPS